MTPNLPKRIVAVCTTLLNVYRDWRTSDQNIIMTIVIISASIALCAIIINKTLLAINRAISESSRDFIKTIPIFRFSY